MSVSRDEDHGASSSSDDEDYVPPAEDKDDVEEDSDNLHGFEEEEVIVEAKRSYLTEGTKDLKTEGDEVEKKKRADALFEAFLADTDEPTTSSVSSSTSNEPKTITKEPARTNITRSGAEKPPEATEDDIFGITREEKRGDENEEVIERSENFDTKIDSVRSQKLKRPAVGLDSALSIFSKKSRTSVLDKSQKDWTEFKNQEGLEDELSTHNRGKDGYLEKIDFLTRADFRQFVNERDARAARRNKKECQTGLR